MIFDIVRTDTVFIVEVKNLNSTRVKQGLGFLKYDQGYAIFTNNKLFNIEILDESKLEEIDFFFRTRNYTAIIDIREVLRDKFFTMEIIFFSYPVRNLYTPFYIGLDENILETAKQRKFIKRKEDIGILANVLEKKVSFEINGEKYFIVSDGNASRGEVFDLETENIYRDINQVKKSSKYSDEEKETIIASLSQRLEGLHHEEDSLAFSLYGDGLSLPIQKDITQSGDYMFKATKLVSLKKAIVKDSIQLIKAGVTFKNGLVSERVAKDLGNIIESDDSFLKKWDDYSKYEGEILLNKLYDVGVLNLVGIPDSTKDGYDLKFEELPDALDEGDYIAFVEEVPIYVKEKYSWTEYIAFLEKQEKRERTKELSHLFKIDKKEHGYISIKTEKNIDDLIDKKAILSIFGDSVQIERKLEARKRLLTGKSANPFLGLIIEDTEDIKNYQKSKKVKKLDALSDDVNKKIFPQNPPTENQIEAIEIALSTPDIAIIQGPPGTGKTTIVTAVIERLNELSDKGSKTKGEVLVTGIQHDAVENIISRLYINGLPTPKYGTKSTTLVDITSFENIMKWSSEITDRVRNNLPELSNYKKISELNRYFEIYLSTPSQRLATKLLKYIVLELSTLLSKEIIIKVEKLLNELQPINVDSTKELKNIYALRTTLVSFNDDGIARNNALLFSSIGSVLTEEEKSILINIDNDLDGYLKKLKKLKFRLINRLYPKATFRSEKPNSNILILKDEIESELVMGGTTKDKLTSVLSEYVNELDSNPFALKSLIEEYSFVFSSTTQQSMGKEISKAKKSANEAYITYDTVIIDEAARVSPMDLLIAMVQAKRRIILVGDHRQLPHIVDENVIKDTELSEDDFITKSMFGYLKERAKTLEKYDGIKRTITLENQYRTHPLLGKFVSENFYDRYEEGFNSPLEDVDRFFKQKLEGIENTPAVWLDVPSSSCGEVRAWSRECEAKKIGEYLKRWILSPEGESLTFGVISFYRKQVEAIENEIIKIFTKDERNSFKDRFKVGTVDSFQGMEFDIVFLSIVRSRDIRRSFEKLQNYNLFGFLISKNRLCVSMSRQKKSLIIVGDREFYGSDRAKKDVEELYNFLQLCKKEGKVL